MSKILLIALNTLVFTTTGVFIFAGALHLIGLLGSTLLAPTLAIFGVTVMLMYIFGTKGIL